MATVKVTITEPLPNAVVVSRTMRVQATWTTVSNPTDVLVDVDRVEIQFGVGSPFVSASKVGSGWRRTGSLPIGSGGGSTVKISARAIWRESPRPPALPDWSDDITSQVTSVSVVLEGTPPVVTVDDYDREPPPGPLPYRLTLSGTAQDEGSGVSVVQYQLGNAPYAAVENMTGDWSEWQKIVDLPAGEHLIKIQALDKFRNASAPISVNVSVRTRFQPSSAELAFAPVTYLQELMSFAERWIKVSGVGPTAEDLANRFFQPFDRLTQADLYELASRQLYQTRIAVEVLRRRLQQMNQPVPAAVGRRFRRGAYEALVLQLGTSHEELRAARIADDASRRALAERLGIGAESARPDRLDQITLMPDAVTEAQLRQLFGFEGTTQDDPLHPVNVAADVLNWRLAATQDRWPIEDAQARDGADGPIPIIDPDLVDEANLLTPRAGNRVYDLWKARKTLIDANLAEVEDQREQGFEHIINSFIGSLDFAALTTQDADGINITPVLDQMNLELSAFRFLAKCRKLAVSGGLLDTEWRDIIDIVVQVQKNRQYPQWRLEESGLSLAPQYFRLADEHGAGPAAASFWRVRWSVYAAWRNTLAVRIRQLQGVKDAYQSALEAAEATALPALRDSLIEIIGRRHVPPESVAVAAERLSRELLIDIRANAAQKTTRVNQAIETLLAALFSVRAGRLATDPPAPNWSIVVESAFDREWQWMAAYRSWRAAMMGFAYPESQLYPNFFIKEEPFLNPTQSYKDLIAALQDTARMTPTLAREKAQEYLTNLRTELTELPPELRADTFLITDELDLVARKELVRELFTGVDVNQPHTEKNYLREVFWLVPMALALQLQRAGHYLAALDWFQTVYAFHLPTTSRKIYYWLELEEDIPSVYERVPEWLREELNPHIFARSRKNAHTRFTVLSITRCFLDFADVEFSQSTAESVGRARTLYETAEDLLNLTDMRPETGAAIPFLPNPVWESLRMHARANLAKIHNGLNIAGMPTATPLTSDASIILPSQYRYAALVERAKQLVGIAHQVESAFLAAMERRDAEAYGLMQAGHDLRVAGATVSLQDLKITAADLTVQMAEFQQEKAQIQLDYFDQQLRNGLNFWETILPIGQWLSGSRNPTSFLDFGQTITSYERREQEWRLQKSLSMEDVQISEQQIRLAQNQRQLALMERELAGLQLDHATAVVDFLVNKFTNAELYEWMSGVLGRVYSYFLQQATAMAQLAQSQLAFERQEPALSVVQSDYWQVIADGLSGGTTDDTEPDRRGLTGSARLLQDIYQLDQYAFETKQRKLQLTQTLSLAQLAPLETQNFRATGQLIFVTPMELFDRDFPGHYLRLIRRVRVSIIALIPPTRGLRATLSASGISRVVTGGETFETVQVRRFPETVAFTAPINATGLFELESEGELLLPFEGMGVDTFWDLQLPKAANPFDYRAIADVLLTIEYTALSSPVYRQQVIKQLDRSVSGERLFSVRDQFADVWYELNNPDAIKDPERRMVANFSTRREDFPPHVGEMSIQHVTLHVARRDSFVEEVQIEELQFTPTGESAPVGGAALTVEGSVSTRRPNGVAWVGMQGKSPVGRWELRLPNTNPVRAWFKEGLIEDLALVVTFGGTTPAWPT